MTVTELIEKIQQMPHDVNVEYEYLQIESIEYDEGEEMVIIHGY